MRQFLMVAAALVAGMLAGYWQPAGEVLRLQRELDGLRGQDCQRINPLRDFLGVQGGAKAEPAPVPLPRVGPAPGSPGSAAGTPAPVPVPVEPAASEPTPEPSLDPFDPAQVGQAAALMDARRAQALAALTEQAGLDGEQRAAVERIFGEMDQTVRASVEGFVGEALEAGTVQRRDALALGADLLDAAVVAEDALWEALPPEVMEGLDPEVYNPINFVGGDTVRALSRLQDVAVEGM